MRWAKNYSLDVATKHNDPQGKPVASAAWLLLLKHADRDNFLVDQFSIRIDLEFNR